jgi:hypothetical protein
MMAMAGAGRRPLEWWEYETEVERPLDLGDAEIALFEMGELTDAEVAEVMPQWRDRYEQAIEPGFSYLASGATAGQASRPQSCGSGMPSERAANVLVYAASKAKFWP